MLRNLGVAVVLSWMCLSLVGDARGEGAVTLDAYLKRLGYAPIRLELDRDNHYCVRGILKGKKERFVLDSGCAITRLDPKLARGLEKLDGTKLKLEDDFLKDARGPGLVVMDELTVSGIKFLNQPAHVGEVVFDFSQVAERGLLGCDFFVRNHCIIDCLHAFLYVRPTALPPDLESDLVASLHQGGFTETGMHLKLGLPTMCKARVNGEELMLVLDTGSPWTVLDWDCGKRLKLPVFSKPTHLNLVGIGKVGAHGLQETQLQTLQLAGATLRRTYVALADMSAWGLADRGSELPEAQGLLGVETLATAGALLDYGTSKLWLNPPSPK
jgi:predicted aspartyl protease